jgi:hypothetical protein
MNVLRIAPDIIMGGHRHKADRLFATKGRKGPFAHTSNEFDGCDAIVGYKDGVDGLLAAVGFHKRFNLLVETGDASWDTSRPACPVHNTRHCCYAKNIAQNSCESIYY